MKNIVYFFGIVIAICSCTKLEDPIMGLTNRVEISTSTVTKIGSDTAFVGGSVKTDGGESIIERGVVWGTSPNPTISGVDRRKAGTGLGNFNIQIDTLIPLKDYYVRAYATNYYGTVYGQQVPFKTINGKPRLGASFLMTKDAYSMKLAATLKNDGGEAIIARGFCISVNPAPSVILPNNSQNRVVTVNNNSSYFETTVGELLPKTNYYVRSYSSNRLGTSYGKQFQVTTEIGTPKIDDPIIISNVEATTVKLTMKITSAEGGNISRKGFAISSTIQEPFFYDENKGVTLYENSPTRTMLRTVIPGPSGTGTYEVTVTGLKPGTPYYVRGYAINESSINSGVSNTNKQVFTTLGPPSVININSSNLSYYSFAANARILGDGGSEISEMGFYVSTNSDPTVNARVFPVGVKLGDFQSTITALEAGRLYYFTAYAKNKYGLVTAEKPVAVLTMANTKPVIKNAPVPQGFNNRTLTVSGQVDSDGGLGILERGFYYSTSPNSYSYKVSQSGNFPQESFSNTITSNLVFGNVQYYVWTFARNQLDETVGPVSLFRTPNKTTPIVRNVSASPSARSATVNGIIDLDGYGTISSTGFLWANNSAMSGVTTISGSGNPNFSGTITGLLPNTTYWYQAFANNELGRSGLPAASSFKTSCEAASVSYVSVATSTSSLLFTYNLTGLGGDVNVTRGVCFSSTNTNPQINGSGVQYSTGTQSTTGNFQASATGLTSRRTYYAQAYATNCFGTVYYGVRSFTTL